MILINNTDLFEIKKTKKNLYSQPKKILLIYTTLNYMLL